MADRLDDTARRNRDQKESKAAKRSSRQPGEPVEHERTGHGHVQAGVTPNMDLDDVIDERLDLIARYSTPTCVRLVSR